MLSLIRGVYALDNPGQRVVRLIHERFRGKNLILTLLMIGLLLSIWDQLNGWPNRWSFLAVFMAFALLLWAIAKEIGGRFLGNLVLGALLIRLATIIAVTALPDGLGGGMFNFSDDVEYYGNSESIAKYWALLGPSVNIRALAEGDHYGYLYLNAILAYTFGPDIFLGKMFNALLGVLAVLIVYAIGKDLAEQAAKIASAITAFFPSLILYSSVNLKESLVVVLILGAILISIRIGRQIRGHDVVTLALTLGFLGSVRFYVALIVMWSIFLYWLSLWIMAKRANKEGSIRINKRSLGKIVPVIGAVVLLVAMLNYLNLGFLGLKGLQQAPILLLETQESYRPTEDSLVRNLGANTLPGLLLLLPVGVARLWLSPLPWKTEGFYSLDILGTIGWYVLVPLAALGLWRGFRPTWPTTFPVSLSLGLLFGMYSLLVFTSFTRMRVQLLPLMAICASLLWLRSDSDFQWLKRPAVFYGLALAAALGILGIADIVGVG